MNDSIKKNKSGRYRVYDEKIPEDIYEVTSVIQNLDGTVITLEGERNTLTVSFGCVQCLSICDEGVRIESYNRIADIQGYRKNGFCGVPVYSAEGAYFMDWLNYESCGFSCSQNHYAVITRNDFIDIAVGFPPKITVTNK